MIVEHKYITVLFYFRLKIEPKANSVTGDLERMEHACLYNVCINTGHIGGKGNVKTDILLNLRQYIKYPLPMRQNLHFGISTKMNRNRNAGLVAMV